MNKQKNTAAFTSGGAKGNSMKKFLNYVTVQIYNLFLVMQVFTWKSSKTSSTKRGQSCQYLPKRVYSRVLLIPVGRKGVRRTHKGTQNYHPSLSCGSTTLLKA